MAIHMSPELMDFFVQNHYIQNYNPRIVSILLENQYIFPHPELFFQIFQNIYISSHLSRTFFNSFISRFSNLRASSLRFSANENEGPHEKSSTWGLHSLRESLICFNSSKVNVNP